MATSDSNHHELTASLERALLRELVAEWQRINLAHFRGALALPSIVLASSTSHLGRWLGDVRVLELSRSMILAQPWAVVIEVLRHEMAHQYVHEFLGETSETPHGPAFRSVCERLGVDPASSGLPTAHRNTTRPPRGPSSESRGSSRSPRARTSTRRRPPRWPRSVSCSSTTSRRALAPPRATTSERSGPPPDASRRASASWRASSRGTSSWR